MFLYRFYKFIIIDKQIDLCYILHTNEREIMHHILNHNNNQIADKNINIHHIVRKYIANKIVQKSIK